ncbi:hypothetical protein [Ottowia sp.]|uniref:hypothetical protein n=1 Tax=Ottowia sp. TaxID=1898956 RepID=UPI003A88E9BD
MTTKSTFICRTLLTISTSIALLACSTAPLRPSPPSDGASPTSPDIECPDVTRLHAAQLYGSWTVALSQTGQHGTLTLRQHPEYSASLRGEFSYGGHTSIASGDVEGGSFNLDESRDGKSLFAFWSGQLTPSACGTEIRGVWQTLPKPGQPEQESPFVLRRPAAQGTGW